MVLLTEITNIQEGDILYLTKTNKTMTNEAQMQNICIVQANIHDELYVADYGGYASNDEPKGMMYLKDLFLKWEHIYFTQNIYSPSWKEHVRNANLNKEAELK